MSNSYTLALISTQNFIFCLLPLAPNYKRSQVHQTTQNDLERKNAKETLYRVYVEVLPTCTSLKFHSGLLYDRPFQMIEFLISP